MWSHLFQVTSPCVVWIWLGKRISISEASGPILYPLQLLTLRCLLAHSEGDRAHVVCKGLLYPSAHQTAFRLHGGPGSSEVYWHHHSLLCSYVPDCISVPGSMDQRDSATDLIPSAGKDLVKSIREEIIPCTTPVTTAGTDPQPRESVSLPSQVKSFSF